MPKYTFSVKKNFGVKNLEKISKFFITILTPPAMCNVTGLYKHDNSKCVTKRNYDFFSLIFRKKIISIISGRSQNTQIWVKKNFRVKKLEKISKFFITILTPPAMCNVIGLYKHDNSKLHQNETDISRN